jgi:RNA polymerase sigma factor (sigma-70 family)
MASREMSVHQCIRRLVDRQRDDESSDRDLLRRFTARRDEEAFATLFRRHGAMVLGVATRVLGQHADAEDVRQATFLLLAKKAGALPWYDSVAGWLHGAAHRLALQSRRAALRRRAHQARVHSKPAPDALADITLRDLQAVLDEELNRLPRKYSTVLVLCCLEGKARDEAAQCLGLPLATVKSRLEEGRAMLRRRLTRRDLALPLVLATVTLPATAADAALPAGLARATGQAAVQLVSGHSATGLISKEVLALVQDGGRAVPMMQLKVALASLVVGLLTVLACGFQGPPPAESAINVPQAPSAPPAAAQPNAEPRAKDVPQNALQPLPGEEVMAVKYSATGEWLVTGEMNGTVRLWNARTQRAGPVLRGPAKMVRSVVFTPDSKSVLAGGDDGNLYVWDVPAGKLRAILEGHRGQVSAIAVASDGKTVATCAGFFEAGQPARRELKIWDLAQPKCVRDIECADDICSGPPGSMAFAPGTDLLAAACTAPFRGIKVWNTTTGKEDRRFTYNGGFPLALAFSPDGKRLAVGGGDAIAPSPTASRHTGHLKIWDWKSGQCERTLVDKSDGHFRALAFSRDGTRLIAGCLGPNVHRNALTCVSNVLYCWECRQWTRLWIRQRLYGHVWDLDIAPNGRSVTSSDESGTAVLETCLGRDRGQWLTTPHRVIAEDFGRVGMLRRTGADTLVNAIDLDSRVYSVWRNGTETFFYRGKAPAANAALRKYAAVKGGPRRLIVLPGPADVQTLAGKSVAFDWQIHVAGVLLEPAFATKHAVLTVRINTLKPRPVDAQKAEQWLKELDSDLFDVRDAAYAELRKLGNDARPALRAALGSQRALETRRRIESLLDRLPALDLTELEVPLGVIVLGAGDLIAQGLEDLKSRDRDVRSSAIQELSGLARFSDQVVLVLTAVAEQDPDLHLRQVAAGCLAENSLADEEPRRRERAIAEEIHAWKQAKTGR